jgi:CheY-like chemotaxis protein
MTNNTDSSARGRILLAEDDDDVAMVASTMLKSRGHEVVRVATADDVLPALIREQPDLLILDVMMPSEENLDGFSLCATIKSKPTHRDLPVIIVSAIASGLGASAEKMREQSGADVFLHKPYSMEELFGVVDRLLAG